jgi:hypothetical protein
MSNEKTTQVKTEPIPHTQEIVIQETMIRIFFPFANSLYNLSCYKLLEAIEKYIDENHETYDPMKKPS